MPQANSITSRPRWMSPRLSASTLPCSLESRAARGSMLASTSRLNSNITRARRWGLTRAQPAWALAAACTASSTSASVAKATLAWTSPVLGSNTSPVRPALPAKDFPSMKWPTVRKAGSEAVSGAL
jgi:hypothetical protein